MFIGLVLITAFTTRKKKAHHHDGKDTLALPHYSASAVVITSLSQTEAWTRGNP